MTVVVKCGGAVAGETAPAVLALAAAGNRVCVVHGAGPQISARMEERGIDVRFVDGRRVTAGDAIGVVRHAMQSVNRELCAAIGPAAVGLMGDQIGVEAERIPKLGHVGAASPARPRAVVDALGRDLIPVVASLAKGPLNVNADEMAAALAVGLDAEQLFFMTDVPGVLIEGRVVPSMGAEETGRLLDAGAFTGGMVPKLRAAVSAAGSGIGVQIGITSVLAAEGL
ncbi:MAG: hypothetical protein ACE5E8_00945 [Acidimicrobiia bacterium]